MADDVEKILEEEKALEQRKQAAVAALLKKREEQNKEIDDQLRALGHSPDGAKPKRTHHKRPAVQPSAIKAKDKPGGGAGD